MKKLFLFLLLVGPMMPLLADGDTKSSTPVAEAQHSSTTDSDKSSQKEESEALKDEDKSKEESDFSAKLKNERAKGQACSASGLVKLATASLNAAEGYQGLKAAWNAGLIDFAKHLFSGLWNSAKENDDVKSITDDFEKVAKAVKDVVDVAETDESKSAKAGAKSDDSWFDKGKVVLPFLGITTICLAIVAQTFFGEGSQVQASK